MAAGNNISNVIQEITPEIAAKISLITDILKAIGIVLIIYIIYRIIKGILNIRQASRIKNIERVVLEIDQKLDNIDKRLNKKKGK